MSANTEAVFSELIHAPIRLRICALLRRVAELEFAALRESLQLSDATLSKHLRLLADAALITLRKEASPARADARRLTWVTLTPEGRIAVERHLTALARIADGPAEPADRPTMHG